MGYFRKAYYAAADQHGRDNVTAYTRVAKLWRALVIIFWTAVATTVLVLMFWPHSK